MLPLKLWGSRRSFFPYSNMSGMANHRNLVGAVMVRLEIIIWGSISSGGSADVESALAGLLTTIAPCPAPRDTFFFFSYYFTNYNIIFYFSRSTLYHPPHLSGQPVC